jgi:flavodoxin
MNVCIVHDSASGNGLQLAERMQEVFGKAGAITKLGHVRELRPEDVMEHEIDLVVVGAAVRKFTIGAATKAWIKGLAQLLKQAGKSISFGAVFLTHGLPVKAIRGYARRLHRKMERASQIERVYPNPITARVVEIKGPFEDGTLERVDEETRQILKWMGV